MSHKCKVPQPPSSYSDDAIHCKQKKQDKKKILIVDDEPDVTLTYKIGLEKEGIEVYTYNDPMKALSDFRPNFYDLLLIDVKMPKMNGFQLYEKIRMLDSEVKVCFFTAFEVYYNALKEMFPSIEANVFIKKSTDPSELVKKIKNEINRK